MVKEKKRRKRRTSKESVDNKKKNSKAQKKMVDDTSSKKRRKKKATVKKDVRDKELEIAIASQKWLQAGEELGQEINDYTQKSSSDESNVIHILDDLAELTELSQLQGRKITKVFFRRARVNKDVIATEVQKGAVPETERKWLGSVLFNAFLVLMLIFLGMRVGGTSSGEGPPKNFGGYAPMTILTNSMARVYPKDTLVIAKVTDPRELEIGDDITYIKENNTTVTHRIVGINEDFQNTGKRAFETKGVENPRIDEELVREENVIGKIVFSSVTLGSIIQFIRENMVLTAVTLILFVWFSDALIIYIKKNRKGAE